VAIVTELKEKLKPQSIHKLEHVLKMFTGSPTSSQLCPLGPSSSRHFTASQDLDSNGASSRSSQSQACASIVTLDAAHIDGDHV